MGWGEAGKLKREVICVYLQRIHVVVWQKPTQYGEVIFLQLRKKKKSMRNRILNYECQQRMEMMYPRGDVGGEAAPGEPFSLVSTGAHQKDKVSV